jgi:hypothetical protein
MLFSTEISAAEVRNDFDECFTGSFLAHLSLEHRLRIFFICFE